MGDVEVMTAFGMVRRRNPSADDESGVYPIGEGGATAVLKDIVY
jgi:hypothetical protein